MSSRFRRLTSWTAVGLHCAAANRFEVGFVFAILMSASLQFKSGVLRMREGDLTGEDWRLWSVRDTCPLGRNSGTSLCEQPAADQANQVCDRRVLLCGAGMSAVGGPDDSTTMLGHTPT